MLNDIKVQNYRNLKSLSIEKLGRVNLVIGRNNTGKTSLLEAIYLFSNKDDADSIFKILISRGENNFFENTDTKEHLRLINNLFWDRNRSEREKIEIISNNGYVSLSIVNSLQEKVIGLNYPLKPYMLKVERNEFKSPRHIVLDGSIENLQFFPPISKGILIPDNIKFVRSTVSNLFRNNPNQFASYLDNISLGDNYHEVIGALQIIDDNIERIAYLSDGISTERFPVVRLRNGERVLLLSMGDGINRILTIILTMVNCENGYLLIDEFENGLHYSVQEKLWEIIFHLAERLNIQVFATTHSNDTIRTFENVVNQNETVPLGGLLIKLENINDNIEATTFEPNELKIITDNLIEVRR